MCRQSATVCLIKSPALDGVAGLSLVERLRLLPDPRRCRGVRHPFVVVLLVAASAVVAGARSCGTSSVAGYGPNRAHRCSRRTGQYPSVRRWAANSRSGMVPKTGAAQSSKAIHSSRARS